MSVDDMLRTDYYANNSEDNFTNVSSLLIKLSGLKVCAGTTQSRVNQGNVLQCAN